MTIVRIKQTQQTATVACEGSHVSSDRYKNNEVFKYANALANPNWHFVPRNHKVDIGVAGGGGVPLAQAAVGA